MQRLWDTGEIVVQYERINEMSTAIIGKWCHDGFVVASDSLGTKPVDGTALAEPAVKIFRLCRERINLVYAVMGNPFITEDESPDVSVMNFPKDVSVFAAFALEANTLPEFAETICSDLNRTLRLALSGGRISAYPSNPNAPTGALQDIVRILFSGYFDERPCQVSVRFFHIDQVLQAPQAEVMDDFHYGSQKIADLIEGGDPYFSKYKLTDPFASPIDRGVEYAKNHIDAYSDPVSRTIANSNCESIGGAAQVCTVNPSGAMWIHGPNQGKPVE